MKKRFAAYCRVSTKKEIQLYSLEAQKQYYKNLIEANEDIVVSGVVGMLLFGI